MRRNVVAAVSAALIALGACTAAAHDVAVPAACGVTCTTLPPI